MSEQLCVCATECEWLTEHYQLKHHPNCPTVTFDAPSMMIPIIVNSGEPLFRGHQLNLDRQCVVDFNNGPSMTFDETGSYGRTKQDCEQRFSGGDLVIGDGKFSVILREIIKGR